MKTCPVCHVTKQLSRFNRHVHRSDGHEYRCKRCAAKSEAAYRQKNPVKVRVTRRRAGLKKRYGLTLDEFNAMASAQDDMCAICHKPELMKGYLSVDHDHTTGKIRGLLCRSCNLWLGKINDSVLTLESAIRYLKGN